MIKGYRKRVVELLDNDSLFDLNSDFLDLVPAGTNFSCEKFTYTEGIIFDQMNVFF